jgi:hypothetical protein
MFIQIDGFQAAQPALHGRTAGMLAGLPVRYRESDRLTEIVDKFGHCSYLKFELLKPA